MGNDVCFLITVLYGNELLRCALKVDRNHLGGDVADYPMEPENRNKLHALLPLHVRNCGPIVAVDDLFEVHCNTETTKADEQTDCCELLVFNLERIETAFFNHDSDGCDGGDAEWEKRRVEWRSFKQRLLETQSVSKDKER